jgi:transposase
MRALSLDIRERILKAYDRGDSTRAQVALRFSVSLGMVKKLLSRRKHDGEIGTRYDRCGRKPLIAQSHGQALRTMLAGKPDMTLQELRQALGLDCSLPAIHYVLADMGLTYKKRLSRPASKVVPTLPVGGRSGSATKSQSTRRALSSWTNRRPKRT